MRFVRASRLVRPGARPHRNRPRLAQLGGGGGGGGFSSTYLTGAVALGTATGVGVTAPTLSDVGDLLVLVVHVGGQNTGLNATPSGWTLVDSDLFATSQHVAVYKRIAAGTGSGNNVSTGVATGADRIVGFMFAESGASDVAVNRIGFTDETFIAQGTPSSTLEIGGVTPTGAGRLHTFAGNGVAASDLGTPAWNDGLTQDLDYFTTGGNNYTMTHGYRDTDGSATSDPITCTLIANNGATYGIVMTVT